MKFNIGNVFYFSPTAAASATTFHFLGSGYASIPKIPNYNSREFQISFHFKTFWANSTLLFAGNEQLVSVLYVTDIITTIIVLHIVRKYLALL